ncbi:MAG TPA: SDR family NAD(P)-dependent oxidoreductase [Acidimicrobiales bacterium]|nr:SDR family NAD(P)-dependent oxidoreductase [Acidimicrobiales bacterium]
MAVAGRLEGKVAVITGGGAGLGRAAALLFAAEGARVVVGSRDPERIARTVDDIVEQGGSAVGVPTDVSREEDVERLVASAVDRFGRLDVMFNNAGIPVPGNGQVPFETLDGGDWDRLLSVNLSGVVYGCKHAVGPMREAGGGSIVNSSSGAAFAALPGWAPYAATKGGINALTRALAVDLGPYNIRVNAVCPAIGVSSNFHQPPGSPVIDDDELARSWNDAGSRYPLRGNRPPGLADSARVAVFLASDTSAFVTGQTVAVDGGLLSKMAEPFTAEYRDAQRRQRETPLGTG